ncbi:aminopeptidase N-like [Nylanderia fulva]|uniref:aminopeptidase N-like n=1 Tax=Nylanderia fulva TaxID=613905 RepID=UPI0010FB4EA5|nr:aminopeptidase N-like [Nylanderia fulva]
MQTIIDASTINKDYKINLKRMINVWAEQRHCPVLNAIRDYNRTYVNISLDKRQYFRPTTFFIPITYTTEMNINFNPKLSIVDHYYLTETNPELKIPIDNEDQWVIIDKQQTGYYRVNYDPENWRRIARYLKSENYTNIHVLNRAQIIDDAFHLMMEKKLNFSIFWQLASYLPRREKDYIAWYPMIKAFEYMSNYFAMINALDEDLPSALKGPSVKIKKMLGDKKGHFLYRYKHIHNQIKLVDDDFNQNLKLNLRKWGCVINNQLCIRIATNNLKLYIQNSTLNKISPGWEEWTYCNGLKTADIELWYAVHSMATRIYKEKSDYKMLKFLSCSENPLIIIQYLWFLIPRFEINTLKDHKMLTQKDKNKFHTLTTNMFLSTLARHAKNTRILERIMQFLVEYSNTVHVKSV